MTLFIQAMAPFEHIETDQMGAFVQSDAGNRYTFVIVDRYSKYIVAWASKSITGGPLQKDFMNTLYQYTHQSESHLTTVLVIFQRFLRHCVTIMG